jgi:hypothetical protein
MHFSTASSSLSHRGAHSVESPDRKSVLVAVTRLSLSSALNTPKFLCIPRAKSPEDYGQGIMQASCLGFRVLFSIHRKPCSGAALQCGEHEVVSHHARTTCVVVDEAARVSRVLANHSPKNDGTLHLFVC